MDKHVYISVLTFVQAFFLLNNYYYYTYLLIFSIFIENSYGSEYIKHKTCNLLVHIVTVNMLA